MESETVKRKAGRPRKYAEGAKSFKMFGVHLPPDDAHKLKVLASSFGCTRPDATIRLIREAYERYNQAMESAWGNR